jgi:hypothetical protein
MLYRIFSAGFFLLLFASTSQAQTAAPSVAPPQPASPSQPAAATQSAASSQPAASKSQLTTRPQPPQRDEVDIKLQQALRERDAIIRNLLERVSELERRLNMPNGGTAPSEAVKSATPAAASPAPAPAAAPTAVASSSSSTAAAVAAVAAPTSVTAAESVVSNSTYDKTERDATTALDQALIVRGGLLLRSGTLEIDQTTSYFSASSNHLAVDGFSLLPILVVGEITSQQVRQNFLLPTFTTRLGLPYKFQMDFNVPYGFEEVESIDVNNNETASRNWGLGDISASISRTVLQEHGWRPDVVANVLYKSTTGTDSFDLQSAETALGTGFPSWQGNLTFAKSNDPLVFYGNLFYSNNLSANHTITVTNEQTGDSTTEVAHIKQGNSEGFQIGSILALNPETSMTMGWDQRFTQGTRINGTGIPSTSLVEGTLRLGVSYLYAPGKTIDLGFGVGLTPDTPNLQFSVGLPLRFQLWNRTKK